jgi:hypothetical protein
MNTLRVQYLGTNVGKIYLSDLQRRRQLGGAPEGASYTAGQDEYMIWGETRVLLLGSDVLFSQNNGVLKFFSTAASDTRFAVNGAPLTLAEGSYTVADEYPRKDLGDTGGTFFADTYMSRLADDKWGPTGAAGATGYFYGNA